MANQNLEAEAIFSFTESFQHRSVEISSLKSLPTGENFQVRKGYTRIAKKQELVIDFESLVALLTLSKAGPLIIISLSTASTFA